MPKYIEVQVSDHFDDDENTIFEALEEGADVGLSNATSRDELQRQIIALTYKNFELKALLTEARDSHITDKPWDDRTHLHDRISDVLGLPRSYPDHPRY